MRTARQVFDSWALDYHADGMEDDHRASVTEAFQLIPPSNGTYLEVGFGNGYGLEHMATNQYASGRCLGIDVSANMVEKALERLAGLPNISVSQADFLTFDPEVANLDLIFSMEVFYYFADIQDGIDRAFSLLAPGGTLWVLVNHYLERPESHGWSSDLQTPMQLWSATDYDKGFNKAGFKDVRQRFLNVPEDPESRAGNPGTLATWGVKPR